MVSNAFFWVLARILPTKTVDGAVAFITKALAQLEAAEADQLRRSQDLGSSIASLQSQQFDADRQVEQARRLRSNLGKLVK